MGAQPAFFSQQDYMFARPDEALLGKFLNARIERSFVGKAVLYARSRPRDPLRSMDLSTTSKPITYKVPIILITDKRMIFLAGRDQLLCKKMGTISTSYFDRSRSTSFVHLYLSPFWSFQSTPPLTCNWSRSSTSTGPNWWITPRSFVRIIRSNGGEASWLEI